MALVNDVELEGFDAFPLDGESQYILAGTGLPGDLLTSVLALDGTMVTRNHTSSYSALVNLYAGRADAAFTHLYDQETDSYNVPFVKHLAPGMPVVAIRLVSVDQGFVVKAANPKGISAWDALFRPDVRLANRELGSGSRILLDEKITSMDGKPEMIAGYGDVFPNGRAAARHIVDGGADVTVGTPSDAGVPDAEFIPMQKGWLDIVIAKNDHNRRLIRSVRDITSSEHMKRQLDMLGRDTSRLGDVVYEC